ncbi:MAG: threonine/serine exporter [Anaerolineae bacterium]|nr:threonine/serine exporter [Anaerolineae bacterium]
MSTLLGLVLEDAFWSAVAAVGFAVLFNVPPRLVWACALTGAVGHMLRTGITESGGHIVLGTLIGATVMGFLGTLLGRWLHAPPPLFNVTGAIPMVPGVFAYSTMIGLIELAGDAASAEVLVDTARNGIQTALILAALAGGITAPRLLLQREKPVV